MTILATMTMAVGWNAAAGKLAAVRANALAVKIATSAIIAAAMKVVPSAMVAVTADIVVITMMAITIVVTTIATEVAARGTDGYNQEFIRPIRHCETDWPDCFFMHSCVSLS